MATPTSNLGLTKPAGTDNALISDLNTNFDKIDGAIGGFRNYFRNGDMGVAQRGNGPFTVDGYMVDGFKKTSSGGTTSITRTLMTLGSAAKWYLSCATSGQAAAGDLHLIDLPIESILSLSGKQVTISFVAWAASGTPSIGASIRQFFGTGGSPSTVVNAAGGSVVISTTPAKYSITFNIPSIAGKTLGTAGDDYLNMRLWLSSGSNNSAFAGIGIQNATINITDIQIEEGAVATPFERISQQQQLAWCQRYFYRCGDNNWSSNDCGASSTTTASLTVRFPVAMRVNPTFTGTNIGQLSTFGTGGGWNPSSVVFARASTLTCDLTITVGSGVYTNGQCVRLVAGVSSYLDFSAEL